MAGYSPPNGPFLSITSRHRTDWRKVGVWLLIIGFSVLVWGLLVWLFFWLLTGVFA